MTDNRSMGLSADVLRTDLRSNPRLLAALAYVSLVVVFVLDAITPQALSIEIAYEASVVLAALSGNQGLIVRVLGLAMLGDVLGCVADAMQSGYAIDTISIENRILSLVSIFTVGALAMSVRSNAERFGRVSARSSRQRCERALGRAADRFWSSLQPARIAPAITEEARTVFDAAEAIWCPTAASEPLLTSTATDEPANVRARPAAASEASAALARVAGLRSVETLPAQTVLAALPGRNGTEPYYLAIPVGGATDRQGVVLVSTQARAADEDTLSAADEFALRALAALQQTQLIEELRLRNSSLAARQRVIEDLVDAIAHDVRTPLTALSVTLSQALEGAFGSLPASYMSVLGDSRLSIDGIQRLAETLLLVARFEAESPRSDVEPVVLREIVREIASELAAMAEAQGLTLRTDVADDATVMTNRADVRRGVANLLANAIRNTPRGGTIDVTVRCKGPAIELAVSDDGYGVEPSVRDSLFQRFSKAGESGGSGLGLYIVRRVAEESGGTVRYEPRTPHGSVFTITLPSAATATA